MARSNAHGSQEVSVFILIIGQMCEFIPLT